MDKEFKAPPSEPHDIVNSDSTAQLFLRFQKVMSDFLLRQAGKKDHMDPNATRHLTNAFMDLTAKMIGQPAKLAENHFNFWQDYQNLLSSTARQMMGSEAPSVINPDEDDRRFRDPVWNENDVFNFIKQSYLLTAGCITSNIQNVEGIDDKTARKVNFYTRQFVNALSPTNFAATNPEVLRETFESGGENLMNGMENLLQDLERSKGQLRISMTDENAFQVGEDLAATPGHVIFRNQMVELIQYAPTTENVFKAPLLIVTPWINKFYILDLRPENSLIKWMVDQGHTVFVTSWVNPDENLADKTFEDYIREGILDSLDAIKKATGENDCNAMGYCLGGTLLAATLGYMAATGDERIKSATYLNTMIDFADPGDLGVFIDSEQLKTLEKTMFARGYLDGAEMAATFNTMRENDLIWSFVIHKYLLGKAPFPFDLLYWNSDSTRMPAAMHSFYLRKMYLENKLVEPGGLELLEIPVDLREINTPTYILSCQEDHIAPWQSAYKATEIYHGPVQFVLAASGHIAGVVNPPTKGKYGYWSGGTLSNSPQTWLASAQKNDGSWWPDWASWVKRHAGKKDCAPRQPGDGKLEAMHAAPGTYVHVRAE